MIRTNFHPIYFFVLHIFKFQLELTPFPFHFLLMQNNHKAVQYDRYEIRIVTKDMEWSMMIDGKLLMTAYQTIKTETKPGNIFFRSLKNSENYSERSLTLI